MMVRLTSADLNGIDAVPVEVEVDVQPGMPAYTTVGLPDAAVKESRERVRGALLNSDFDFPLEQVTVNLAPAELKKEGAQLDLPIAIALLKASGQLAGPMEDSMFMFVGELALSGRLRPVKGILSTAILARNLGKTLLCPQENIDEASIVDGCTVLPVGNLRRAVSFLREDEVIDPAPHRNYSDLLANPPSRLDFRDVRGQAHVKRAMEVAAAGGHNMLMMGPPGSGKSMLAKRLPTVLPPMSFEEALETTRIHSVRGAISGGEAGIFTMRPFRAPHHTISYAGMLGGGSRILPGEISLAHNGVLFLDELTEFKKDVLESLRQPLENRTISIARARNSLTFPAAFTLVAASNPCPCGYYGDSSRQCRCTPNQIRRYLSRLSGPLLDRMDIQVEVNAVSPEKLRKAPEGESSSKVRERVTVAREIQWKRFSGTPIHSNSQMDEKMVDTYCSLDREAENFLLSAMRSTGITARGHHRILKVARTLADLESGENIKAAHIAEAVQYRTLDRKLFS